MTQLQRVVSYSAFRTPCLRPRRFASLCEAKRSSGGRQAHSALTRFIAQRRGVSLIEILIGMIIIVVASIGTLTYFSYGLGGIGKSGNRRAALERARERLEELIEANIDNFNPRDGVQRWVTCTGSPCAWALSLAYAADSVSVDDLAGQPMETTVQWLDDVDTPPSGETDVPDVLALDVKVWFTANTGVNDDFNRVHLRTLRSP